MLFYSCLGSGDLSKLNKPPRVLLKLLESLNSVEDYKQTLQDYNLIEIREGDGEPIINLGFENVPDGVKISDCGEWRSYMTHNRYLQQTGRNLLLDNIGNKIIGIKNDIKFYDTLYNATINNYDTQVNQFCRSVLVDRNYDWVEYMRQEVGDNPAAIVQDAEELVVDAEEKINIDEEKMKKYIMKILGSEIFA